MQPADVADRILRGLEAGEDEIRIGAARLLHGLGRAFPGLATALLKRG